MSRDDARRARAAARSSIPIRRVDLVDEASPDLSHLSASERVAMVWELTLDAWASSGESIPDYARAETPGRMLRLRATTSGDAA
ncbi:MAG: hypothetical protein R3B40_31925 [Polyangiales bacterium]|nr:hypothetical protein [Sandaracinaceae bacterium]